MLTTHGGRKKLKTRATKLLIVCISTQGKDKRKCYEIKIGRALLIKIVSTIKGSSTKLANACYLWSIVIVIYNA